MSELLFPRTAGGVTWELIAMMEDMSRMVDYNWSQSGVELPSGSNKEMKEKIPMKKNLQMHDFAMMLQI